MVIIVQTIWFKSGKKRRGEDLGSAIIQIVAIKHLYSNFFYHRKGVIHVEMDLFRSYPNQNRTSSETYPQ